MIKNTILLMCGLIGLMANAQEAPFCTTHSLSDAVLEANPQAKLEYDKLEAKYDNYISNKALAKQAVAATHPNRVIPVVFHIIHDYNSSYISEAQVASAIENINLDFQKENPDTANVVDAFKDIIGDANLTFRLAQLDPDGNCTKGVTRTFSPLTNIAGENVKELVKWDPSKYLNVWIVETVASGAGGYSYLPGTAPLSDNNAGIVVRHEQFGGTGTSQGAFNRHTLSHEIGHYLGLRHTWGGTNTPNVASNCGSDDGISDTPLCIGQSFNCDLEIETCGSLDNVQNFMCYAGCPSMFTEGQTDRVHFFLNTHTTGFAPRNNLWQQSNLIATGTNDNYVPQECAPIADLHLENTQICVDFEVTLNAYAYNTDAPVTYQWSLPGSTNPTQTGVTADASYSTPGVYNVQLTATNNAGSHIVIKNQYITVRETGNAQTLPYYENFENTVTFNDPTISSSWLTESQNSDNWTLESNTGFSSNKSMKASTSNFEDGPGIITLTMPVLDLTDAETGTKLYFRYAFRQNEAYATNKLAVYISKNCGATWTRRKNIATEDLITVNAVGYSSWTPNTDSEWETTSINLNSGKGIENLMIRFELEGWDQGYVFIDKLELHSYPLGQDEIELNDNALSIFPNPITENSVISINDKEGENYRVSIQNLLGQTIESWEGIANSNQTLLDLPNNLSTGVYLVQLNINGKQSVKKVVVN